MDENEIFRKFSVPLTEYNTADELEKAVLAALNEQFEGDFEPGELEHFWIRFEFPNLMQRSLYGDLEFGLEKIVKRFLSNQPSMWQPNDYTCRWGTSGACVDFWMGPADLMSIIH